MGASRELLLSPQNPKGEGCRSQQQASRDPLSAEELLLSKRVETNESGTLDALVAHVRQHLPGL